MLNPVVDRSLAGEDGILVQKRDPAIRQILPVAKIERLEDTDQEGDSHELVLVECSALHLSLPF